MVAAVRSDTDHFDSLGRRIMLLNNETAERLGVQSGDIVEYVPDFGIALRAWVEISNSLAPNETLLGPRGIAMLGIGDCGEIWIREPWSYYRQKAPIQTRL